MIKSALLFGVAKYHAPSPFLCVARQQKIVWNPATGDQVATIKLPEIEQDNGNSGGDGDSETPPYSGGEETSGGSDGEVEPDALPDNTRRDSSWYGYYTTASVDSMLLLGDKLVVVASGYGSKYQYSNEHAIDHYLATRVFVYDISGLPASATEQQDQVYEPLATKDLNGYFVSARAIQGNVHLVTTTGLQYWERVIMPFEKNWDDELRDMSDEEYIAAVTTRANEEVIPEFVSLLIDDLKVDGKLPFFAKINTYDDGSGSNLSHRMYPDGYMESIAFVFSFDIDAVTSTSGPELTGVSASGSAVPASYPIVYASQDTMIVATSGMGYSEERDAMLTKTYLMSFLLSEASSQPHSMGSVFGDIINQYSMDVLGGVLRIATTIRQAWFWGIPEVMEEDVDSGEPDSSEADAEEDIWSESTTENYIITIDIEGSDGVMGQLAQQ